MEASVVVQTRLFAVIAVPNRGQQIVIVEVDFGAFSFQDIFVSLAAAVSDTMSSC